MKFRLEQVQKTPPEFRLEVFAIDEAFVSVLMLLDLTNKGPRLLLACLVGALEENEGRQFEILSQTILVMRG